MWAKAMANAWAWPSQVWEPKKSLLDQRIWPINQRQANAAYHIAGLLVRKTLAVHQIDICQ